MAGVRGRLDRLEQESESLFQTLALEDGTRIRYVPEEMLDAISAAIHGDEHWLLSFVRREGAREGLASLINALETSYARVEESGYDA